LWTLAYITGKIESEHVTEKDEEELRELFSDSLIYEDI
jgi:hypothetical protein